MLDGGACPHQDCNEPKQTSQTGIRGIQTCKFFVRTILMDRKFKKNKSLLPSIECNMTAAKEHVSKAKQTIQMVKERIHGYWATLAFSHIPKRMNIEFIYLVILS